MTVYPTNDVAEKARIRVLDQNLEDLAKDRKRGYKHLTCPVCAEKICPATYETTCERCENIVHDGCSESSTCDDAYRKIPAFTTVCETCRELAPLNTEAQCSVSGCKEPATHFGCCYECWSEKKSEGEVFEDYRPDREPHPGFREGE